MSSSVWKLVGHTPRHVTNHVLSMGLERATVSSAGHKRSHEKATRGLETRVSHHSLEETTSWSEDEHRNGLRDFA